MYAKTILAILPFLATIKAMEYDTRIKPNPNVWPSDDLCLTLTSGKVKVGEEVHLSKCIDDSFANSKYQKWSGPPTEDDKYGTISIESPEGARFCVDRGPDGSIESWNPVPLCLAECHDQDPSDSQLWTYGKASQWIMSRGYINGCMYINDRSEVRPDDLLPLYKAIEYWACDISPLAQFNLSSPAITSMV